MLKSLLSILAVFILATTANSQAVHYLRCVEVMDGGDVKLTWVPPVNQADFVEYNIYYRVPPGAFSLIDNITSYNSTEYIHTSSTADLQKVQYFIATEQVSLPPAISDTMNTIHLTVSMSSADPIIAALNWNSMHVPHLPSSSGVYRIMTHTVSDPNFITAGSSPDTSFEMPVLVCRDTLYFQIEIDDNSCTSKSNIPFMFFEDITPPPIPVLDSVSINPFTGEAILGWGQSSAGDAGGYVIYNVLETMNDTLAFVFGAGNTSYYDMSFDPCMQNRTYALAAFDTCEVISPGSYDIPHRTIFFNEIVFDPCEMANTISWTEYINMSPSLQGYRVYLSVDGAPYSILTTLPAGTNVYYHENLEVGHVYQYFIRAFSSGDLVTSSSCIRELTTWQYKQPVDNRLANASVINNELVEIILLPDTFAYVPGLNLYRATLAGGPFELVAELEPGGEELLYYDDISADVNNQSYYYRSSLIDSCGNEVLHSDLMRTILLAGEKVNAQMNELSWNAFEEWPAGVNRYDVYRAINESGNFELIGNTDEFTLTFEDDISSLPGDFSTLHYIVRAVDAGSNGQYSWSNEIFFEYEPSLYLPNAFTPEGLNPVFKPVGTFAEFSEYRFEVYNRWGQLLFTSHDFGLGWDGIYNGSYAPAGVYVCIISYSSNTREQSTIKSTFILIR